MFKFTQRLSVALGLMAVCAQGLCILESVNNAAAAIENKTESVAKICAEAIKGISSKNRKRADIASAQKSGAQNSSISREKKTRVAPLLCAGTFHSAELFENWQIWNLPFAEFEISLENSSSQTRSFFLNRAEQIGCGIHSAGALPPIRAPAALFV